MCIRVLHVDDEPDIRDVVEISLGLDSELETCSCASGHDALSLAKDWTPDIILLDVSMPVLDGPATLEHLRHDNRTAQIPVVFLTTRVMARELRSLRSLGPVGIIQKPFDPMTLPTLVREFARSAPLAAHLVASVI